MYSRERKRGLRGLGLWAKTCEGVPQSLKSLLELISWMVLEE